MIWIVFLALLAALIFGPAAWVQFVMRKHAGERSDLPGTGADLARHLLDRFGLEDVKVASFQGGDHYDPTTRTVNLSPRNHDGRSVTAAAVAAHEVSHAFQHREEYPPFQRRQGIVKAGIVIDRIGSALLFGLSIMGSAATSPRVMLIGAAAVLFMGLARVLAHLSTLPVELDASFNRALPILARDGYLAKDDLFAARRVLKAAAYTYVAGALMQLLNLFRLFRR